MGMEKAIRELEQIRVKNMKHVIKKNIKKLKNIITQNAGSTMVETMVSFVVLAIVLAALYGMVRLATNLRMRAIDTAKVRESFNDEIYKSGAKNDVEEHEYFGSHSTITGNDGTMFTLKVNMDSDKTNYKNLDVEAERMSEELRVKFIKSIEMPDLDATGMVSKDSRIEAEKLATPRVLCFDYNETPEPVSP